MTEIVFIVEEDAEGGFVAHALGAAIVAQADDFETLKEQVRDAVHRHFQDDAERPGIIRLHYVRDEVIASWNCPAISVAALARLDYAIDRQPGVVSGLQAGSEAAIRLPYRHTRISRFGTLNAVIREICRHHKTEKARLVELLFAD